MSILIIFTKSDLILWMTLRKSSRTPPGRSIKKILSFLNVFYRTKFWSNIKFDTADFWVQFHGVPSIRLNIAYISYLASKVGDVYPIPTSFVKDWATFARAKVSVRISEKLKRSVEGELDHGLTCR